MGIRKASISITSLTIFVVSFSSCMEVTGEGESTHIWVRKKKINYKNYLQFSIYYHSTSAAVWADIHNNVTKRGTCVSRQMKESRGIGSSRMCIRRRFEEDAEMRRYK